MEWNEFYDLALAYARVGCDDWKTQPRGVKSQAKRMGVRIVGNEAQAAQALSRPFNTGSDDGTQYTLIPIPNVPKVRAAFFAPWREKDADLNAWSFDLVVLRQQPIAFRLEPGTQDSSSHGYDHVQLSESLGGRRVELRNSLSALPTSYPAFPIPSANTGTRFLALLVAMHGFPEEMKWIETAFKGAPGKKRHYFERVKEMLKA